MKILADASLPGLVAAFPKPFELTLYHQGDDIKPLLCEQEILLCRSTLQINTSLIKGCKLRYIATASSGIDHIDETALKNHSIQLIDAKGSNARSVADYVVATIAYLQKHNGFRGKKAGIIGFGAVGSHVAARLNALNFAIVYYDPPKALQHADFLSCSLAEILTCDLICIHANLHDTLPYPSRNLLSESAFSQLKSNCVIINASRGNIVSETALLNLQKPIFYCTDVYANEPNINKEIIDFSTLCTPHIAGHSIDAKYAAVVLVSQKIHNCYKLPLPNYANPPIAPKTVFDTAQSWQDYALSLYNPAIDTLHLKQAGNKKDAFLQWRKAHVNRHDFCAYNSSELTRDIQVILKNSIQEN